MTTLELQGIAHELKFWQGFVKTERFLDGWVANKKTPELNQDVADFILSVPHETVLDVGSGVVSLLNGFVDVTPVDPLGGLYELIFDYDKYGLKAPLPIPAEELEYKEKFDIVHISNALDHCQNPFKALCALFSCVKKDGYLIVQGFENEAEFENWQGFHQWNIRLNDLKLEIGDKTGKTFIENIPCFSKTFELPNGKSWFIFIFKK